MRPTGGTSPTTSVGPSSPASSSGDSRRNRARLDTMPTRKQRRRQQKLRRHEWEEVWVDEEGREIEPPPEPAQAAPRKTTATTTTKRSAPARGAARMGRQPSPPSWNKVVKRGAIFEPIMFIVVYEL